MPISPQPPLAAASQPAIRYPLEYFAAPIAFASRIAAIADMSFLEALSTYTDVRSEITGAAYRQEPNEHEGERVIGQIGRRSPEEIAQIVYAIYVEQPHAVFDAQWAPPDTTRFGALGVSTSAYNRERNRVKLHFLPTRNGGCDLASARLPERRADMRRLLAFVKATHPTVENITSSSWLQNIPTYRALFPPSFARRLAGRRDAFLGAWGQFVRWNGAANQQRYDAFIDKLRRAETIDAAIDAFPLQVLGAVGPLEEFYDVYDVR